MDGARAQERLPKPGISFLLRAQMVPVDLFSLEEVYMGSCQNDGPFLGTLNIRCRILLRTQEGTIILTTTHMTQ